MRTRNKIVCGSGTRKIQKSILMVFELASNLLTK